MAEAPLVRRIVVLPIRFYQRWISPAFPPSCKYYPCCSEYGRRAILERGVVAGIALTAWRLLRCNPFSGGGVDHVPPRRNRRAAPHAIHRETDVRAADLAGPTHVAVDRNRAVAQAPAVMETHVA